MLTQSSASDGLSLRGEQMLIRALRDFEIVSYNCTGIAVDDAELFTLNLQLNSDADIFLLQEFSSDMSFRKITTASATILIAPGISKASRSNATVVNWKWSPWN